MPTRAHPRPPVSISCAVADRGSLPALLRTITPLPPAASSVAAAAPGAAAVMAAAATVEKAEVCDGPFGRGGHGGGRLLLPQPSPSLAMRYPPCHTPVELPADFTPSLISRSATAPTASLCREFVHGYAPTSTSAELHRAAREV